MLIQASLHHYSALHCITCPLLGHWDRVTGSDQTTSHHNDLTKTSTCFKLGSIHQLPNIVMAGVSIDISASLVSLALDSISIGDLGSTLSGIRKTHVHSAPALDRASAINLKLHIKQIKSFAFSLAAN